MKLRLALFAFIALLFSVWFVAEPAAAQSAPAQSAAVTHAFTKDTVIYVSDFELDVQDVTVDKGGGRTKSSRPDRKAA